MPTGAVVGTVTPIQETEIHALDELASKTEEAEEETEETPPASVSAPLSPDQEGKFEKLLEKKPHLFAEKDIELGSTGVKKCAMKTTEAYPMCQKASRIPFMKRPQVEKHVHSMLEAGVIRPSTSPWASPIVLVPKRGSEETRFCVDFRRVNSVTVQNSYPLPNIDEILAAFCGAKYFSKMDLKARYWQIEMEEESKPKPRS